MKKQKILKEIEEDEFLNFTDNFFEAIYVIDNKMVSGNFDSVGRTVDHKELLHGDCTWNELLHYGTVLVPECQTAIGTKEKKLCKMYGYKMLPVHKNNHIMGYA